MRCCHKTPASPAECHIIPIYYFMGVHPYASLLLLFYTLFSTSVQKQTEVLRKKVKKNVYFKICL